AGDARRGVGAGGWVGHAGLGQGGVDDRLADGARGPVRHGGGRGGRAGGERRAGARAEQLIGEAGGGGGGSGGGGGGGRGRREHLLQLGHSRHDEIEGHA